tara:strand:- start:8356 stop:8685 length:330 start_codon:yes stop_codon:yes gene_type:complete
MMEQKNQARRSLEAQAGLDSQGNDELNSDLSIRRSAIKLAEQISDNYGNAEQELHQAIYDAPVEITSLMTKGLSNTNRGSKIAEYLSNLPDQICPVPLIYTFDQRRNLA